MIPPTPLTARFSEAAAVLLAKNVITAKPAAEAAIGMALSLAACAKVLIVFTVTDAPRSSAAVLIAAVVIAAKSAAASASATKPAPPVATPTSIASAATV